MKKEIIHDSILLAVKSEAAAKDDLNTAHDLLDTLTAHGESCVGMAANMIGIWKRIIAFLDKSEGNSNFTVMLNPEIIRKSGPYVAEEGCLSLLGGQRKCKRWHMCIYIWKNMSVKYMIDINNKNYQPDLNEFIEFTANPLFNMMCGYLDTEYNALKKSKYSGDNILAGWNLKFKKSWRTLCTVYPRQGHFLMLLVIGRKEKERVESILPDLSDEFRNVYNNTKEGMGERWLLFDFIMYTQLYNDVQRVIRIRRESR